MLVWSLVIVALLVTLAACSSDDDAPSSPSGSGSSSGEPCAELQPIGDFGEVEVAFGDDPECLLLAQTPEERARGLMEIEDLAGYPGMLFVFPTDSEGGFWMRNTPMPLSIAYLDADGRIVSTADMDPCGDVDTCPSYPAAGAYRFTVEVPQGDLEELGLTGDVQLRVLGTINPS